MTETRPPEESQFAALDRLLSEAGSVAANWRLVVFRAHGAQEARRLYIPPPGEIGFGKFKAALALRTAMSALVHLRTEAACEHAATALNALVSAVRAEPSYVPEPVVIRPYWLDRE